MAIVNIYGFQNYSDYTSASWNYEFTPFGKLPFYNNHYRYGSRNSNSSGFRFIEFEDRVWLKSVPGEHRDSDNYQENAVVSVSFNAPIRTLFGSYVDDSDVKRFTFGCRWWWPVITSADDRPSVPLTLTSAGGNSETDSYTPVRLLDREETPRVVDVTFYMEFEFDFELGVVKRWIDSVRMTDVSLGHYSTRENFNDAHLHFGNKIRSNDSYGFSRNRNEFGLNDFYFIADTSHLNDGLPSKRLGPIEVEALKPKAVVLPATWDNETGKEPEAFLRETIDEVDMRNKPALVSDNGGDKATVEFEEPAFKEGEIIYCELETYAYRDFGDSVALNAQVEQGTGQEDPKQFEIEPERLRTQERAIQPAKLHKPLDGEQWTEEKLGQIKLNLWSSKPE